MTPKAVFSAVGGKCRCKSPAASLPYKVFDPSYPFRQSQHFSSTLFQHYSPFFPSFFLGKHHYNRWNLCYVSNHAYLTSKRALAHLLLYVLQFTDFCIAYRNIFKLREMKMQEQIAWKV